MSKDLPLLSIEVRKDHDHGYIYNSTSPKLHFEERWVPNSQQVFFLAAVDTLIALGVARPNDTLSNAIDEFIERIFKAQGDSP